MLLKTNRLLLLLHDVDEKQRVIEDEGKGEIKYPRSRKSGQEIGRGNPKFRARDNRVRKQLARAPSTSQAFPLKGQ
jgi:hypothetical protein